MDSKTLSNLNNAIAQLGAMSHTLTDFTAAAKQAQSALIEAANAEEARDAAKAELEQVRAERDAVRAEVAETRAELADLVAKREAALKQALAALDSLK